ncbi:MAG: HAD-IA family hydrolase [Armatimonadetes bacterium]|nr:HAD-IA family hydrolase [Armatimonadota bacterium]NIM24948.1 HAD-IA family hydrolase [Armatimonadota bacterium]NIM68834.1 HAD-IA family hydrolase [Armatimonadota bacterium]NIM76660.1 HAD-IA family hydrolase [Armatimonadota bacterium]NIN07039.1 HAD-IA family hydrolase [Armatimonadota bacterium]
MVRACVFDLGGVIFDFDFGPFYERVLPHCRAGVSKESLARLVEARHEKLERGLARFSAYYERYAEEVGLRIGVEEFTVMWSDIFTEKPETTALLRRLKDVRLFMLSNTDEAHIAWVRERFGEVMGLFEKCFFSYELGAIKPAPEVFRGVENVTGLAPEAHLLIDDIEANVQAALNAGWQGVRFRSAAELEKSLRSAGVEITN